MLEPRPEGNRRKPGKWEQEHSRQRKQSLKSKKEHENADLQNESAGLELRKERDGGGRGWPSRLGWFSVLNCSHLLKGPWEPSSDFPWRSNKVRFILGRWPPRPEGRGTRVQTTWEPPQGNEGDSREDLRELETPPHVFSSHWVSPLYPGSAGRSEGAMSLQGVPLPSPLLT